MRLLRGGECVDEFEVLFQVTVDDLPYAVYRVKLLRLLERYALEVV